MEEESRIDQHQLRTASSSSLRDSSAGGLPSTSLVCLLNGAVDGCLSVAASGPSLLFTPPPPPRPRRLPRLEWN